MALGHTAVYTRTGWDWDRMGSKDSDVTAIGAGDVAVPCKVMVREELCITGEGSAVQCIKV